MYRTSMYTVYGKWIKIACKYKNKFHEKSLGETQTLRAGCSKVEPKIFAPPLQTPFAGRRKAKI